MNRLASFYSEGGFFTSGASHYGGSDGGAERFAGASSVSQPCFGLPPHLRVGMAVTQTVTEAQTMANITTTGTTTSAHIIPTFKSTIGGIPALCCDARTLHAYLGNARQFSDWFKQRCDHYGFEAGKDFDLISQNSEIKKQGRGGDRRSTDYHLSLNMAKELSMVENNEQGRAARRYFLECEKKALEAAGQVVPASHTETITPSEQQNLQELVDAKCRGIADQGKARAEIWSRLHHKFRIAKYSQLPRTQLTAAQLYIMGMELRQPEPPKAAPEYLTHSDMVNLKNMVWWISSSFQFDQSWRNGLWHHLRRVTNTPSPQQFTVEQLPRIARELQIATSAAEQIKDLMMELEKEACKRIFRRAEDADMVIADIHAKAAQQLQVRRQELAKFPRYLNIDLLAITDRKTGCYQRQECGETYGYFAA